MICFKHVDLDFHPLHAGGIYHRPQPCHCLRLVFDRQVRGGHRRVIQKSSINGWFPLPCLITRGYFHGVPIGVGKVMKNHLPDLPDLPFLGFHVSQGWVPPCPRYGTQLAAWHGQRGHARRTKVASWLWHLAWLRIGFQTRNSEDKRFHLEIILSLARNAVMIPSNAFLPILRENSKHGTWGCSTFRQPVLIDFEGFITWPAYDRFIFFQFLPVFIWGFGAGRSSKIDGLCRARDARVAEVSPTFFLLKECSNLFWKGTNAVGCCGLCTVINHWYVRIAEQSGCQQVVVEWFLRPCDVLTSAWSVLATSPETSGINIPHLCIGVWPSDLVVRVVRPVTHQ